MAEHNNLCVGMDLGTTNSVVAIAIEKPNGEVVSKVVSVNRADDTYSGADGKPMLAQRQGDTLPSCVYYMQARNYEPIVGDFAKRQYPLRPYLVAKSIKSQMGREKAEGLAVDVPDKAPADVSARILEHMLKEVARKYRCDKISDAVITVPANFDPAMCQATKLAAHKAGIQLKDDNGSNRVILLSEPRAVVHDLVNQIRNGEIPQSVLDLSSPQKILVFDIGGGTLDITALIISRDSKMDLIKVEELATNRYTLLGGDDFDEAIAKKMYERYLAQYSKYPDVVEKLKREKAIIMPKMREYAEMLKFKLNEHCGDDTYSSAWFEDDSTFSVGGSMSGIGYSYDDTFTQEEIEEILNVFMGCKLAYGDYKDIQKIQDTNNIIYPILDVLKKASDKLDGEDIKVNAVILNGGMSKFYMVKDRLKDFFGFEPITTLDPDLAVARGAAIYHYYLHKYDIIKEEMESGEVDTIQKKSKAPVIEWGSSIVNESLYLGLKNGVIHPEPLVSVGSELPYHSEVFHGFRLAPGQVRASIPIKLKNIDGSYRNIAIGEVVFDETYNQDGLYISFKAHMEEDKVIKMEAWTSTDFAGQNMIQKKTATIVIDNQERVSDRDKVMAPNGSSLNAAEEMNHLLQLFRFYGRNERQIKLCVETISKAKNKQDFAPYILEAITNPSLHEERAKQRLFILAKRLVGSWNATDRMELAHICMMQLHCDLNGFASVGRAVDTNRAAIEALSICGTDNQIQRLEALESNSIYRQALICIYGETQNRIEWVVQQCMEDMKKAKQNKASSLSHSARYLAIALRKDTNHSILFSTKKQEKLLKDLCKCVQSGNLQKNALTACIMAIGSIADQRSDNALNPLILDQCYEVITTLEEYYKVADIEESPRTVARKMVNGIPLNTEEGEFLVEKVNMAV